LIVSAGSEAYNLRLMHIVIKNGLAAAKKNMVPGLLLQGFALLLVLLYYLHRPTQQVLASIPAFQQQMGLLFPIGVTALCGGLLPFIFMWVQREIPHGKRLSHLLFLLSFWAINGLIIDYLYRFQAFLFGDQPDLLTVVKKVCFDQFVFSAFFSAPFAAVAMKWKQCDFSFRKTRAELSLRKLAIEIPSVLISLWSVWIPAVAIIYSLPLALQFPLFNIVLCFWSLLLTALTHGEASCSQSQTNRLPST
jgi:hypothetical protein